MRRLGLSRREMGKRLGVSADRITQWLCLLKLPEEKLREIEGLGDYWERQTVTEREMRRLRIAEFKSNRNTTTWQSDHDIPGLPRLLTTPCQTGLYYFRE